VNINYATIEELLIVPEGEHVQQCGEKGAPLKELQQMLPNHTRGQVQALLREMRDGRQVKSIGRTNAARWFLADE
jgi:ATP-dependent DNA helicase RecG